MHCIKCGKEIDTGNLFCPSCGAKQVATYKEVFVRNGLSEKDFIANINRWFQWHPKAANIKCHFDINTGIGLLANKYELNQFVMEYELLENDNVNQYGLVKEENIALIKKDAKEFIAHWQQTHPKATLVNWQGGTHSRGQMASHLLGGIGAANRLNVYILFKFPRQRNT